MSKYPYTKKSHPLCFRRHVVLPVIGLLLLAAGLCAFFLRDRKSYELHKYQYYDVLDTFCEIQVYLAPDQDSDTLEQQIHEDLQYYHRLFDAYHSYDGIANVCTINENAGSAAVTVDEPLFSLLQFCLEQYENTQGRTNIALGRVSLIWKNFMNDALAETAAAKKDGRTPEYTLPDETALVEATAHTDIHDIQLDSAAHSVYLADPGMRLDVGAAAKGFIAERLAKDMEEAGIVSACINLGGNLKILGKRLAGDGRDYYTAAIKNPEDPQTYLNLVLCLTDQATVVTSGNYERYVDVDGVRYCHLIDPDTSYPSHQMSSVTIVANDSALADYLSTALFTVDYETGRKILSRYEGVEALWITEDYRIYQTEGLKQYLR